MTMRSPIHFARRFAKEALLALLLSLSAPAAFARLAELESFALKGAFLALCAITWGGVIAAAYVRQAPLRWLLALIIGIASYFPDVFERVTAQFLTYDAFITMVESAGFAGDAVAQNGTAFVAAMPMALLTVCGIGVAPKRTIPIVGKWLGLVPLLSFAALSGLLFLRGGDGGRGQAPGLVLLSYSALAGYEEATGYSGPRRPPLFEPDTTPQVRNIVLIVDESIAPLYLDINDPAGVETPLSKQWDSVAIGNYGVAAAISGCSASTNVTLRFGGTRAKYREMIDSYPAIWAYAKRAEMRTVHVDGQTDGGALQNFMDAEEAGQIDELVQFDDVEVVQRDQAIASELVRQLARPEPKFILVNKVGAHFPVHDKFPDDHLIAKPALPRGGFTDIVDTGSRAGFGGSPEEWRQYRNSYRNTLAWNVAQFFETLLEQADLSDTLIIYTSDHGQILHENGEPGTVTHCRAEPDSKEGAVPLVLLSGNEALAPQIHKWSEANINGSSHYMVFPTILEAMGYPGSGVTDVYGNGLLQPSADPMTFNTRFNARLNAQPVWRKVDLDELPRPPASDAQQ